jgi:hypothetical protein
MLGHDLLTEAELDAWCQALEGRTAWWRQRGATYLFVITPNKSTIYPEKLSGFFQGQLKPGKLDQLMEHLRKRGCRAPVLDLRPVLLQAKAQHLVYRATDSHWNAEGLLSGSDAIMRRLQELRAPFRQRDEASWFRSERLLAGGDCIWLLAMIGRWPLESYTQLRLTMPPDARSVQTPVSAQPLWKSLSDWNQPIAFERESGVGNAVMLCDSFFRVGGLAPEMFAQPPLFLNFRRFVSLWPWASATNLATYEVLAGIAEMEKPTVVIEQWTERYLRTLPPDHPEFQRARTEVFSGSAP